MMHINLVLPLVVQLVYALVCSSKLWTVTHKAVAMFFASFLNFCKAFDKVSYWKLFYKLLDDETDVGIVQLLPFWYSH